MGSGSWVETLLKPLLSDVNCGDFIFTEARLNSRGGWIALYGSKGSIRAYFNGSKVSKVIVSCSGEVRVHEFK